MTGAELVAWMNQAGWSAAGLARAARVSEATVWRWRRGSSEMSSDQDRALRSLRTRPEQRSIKQRRMARDRERAAS